MKNIIPIIMVIILVSACKKDPSPTTPVKLKDIDGNVYDTVIIGSQIWIKQNLKTSRYRNGDPIPEITNPGIWASLTSGAWCWYNNDSATYAAAYGKLYNWYAVHDPRGLAPIGYHIPSDVEWKELSTFLGGDREAAGKLKEIGTTHWFTPNVGATNNSRFTALPGGIRSNFGGHFGYVTTDGNWWSSTEANSADAILRGMPFNFEDFYRGIYNKARGSSVRCLRD